MKEIPWIKHRFVKNYSPIQKTRHICRRKSESQSNFVEKFDFYLNDDGERIYRYTFESYLESAREKQKRTRFIEGNEGGFWSTYAEISCTSMISSKWTTSVRYNRYYNRWDRSFIKGKVDFAFWTPAFAIGSWKRRRHDIFWSTLMRKEYFSTYMLSRLASNSIITQFAGQCPFKNTATTAIFFHNEQRIFDRCHRGACSPIITSCHPIQKMRPMLTWSSSFPSWLAHLTETIQRSSQSGSFPTSAISCYPSKRIIRTVACKRLRTLQVQSELPELIH